MAQKQNGSFAGRGYVCFPVPEIFRDQPTRIGGLLGSAQDEPRILAGRLNDEELAGLSGVIHTLMCGEESAVNIFHHESSRVGAAADLATAALLNEIAAEEAEHERMLLFLQQTLPVPPDLDRIRRRAKYFFIRVASRDPAVHFSRIAALDGGVCITLKQMLAPEAALGRAEVSHRMLTTIWRDESRHVKVSRSHASNLGISARDMRDEAARVRLIYADKIVLPLADDWERIGVDTDKLYKRIVRSDVVDFG